MMLNDPEAALDLTVKFGLYFLLPAMILFLIFFFVMSGAQIAAFAKWLTPYPKWCWIFCLPVGMAATMLLKLAGNNAVAHGLTAEYMYTAREIMCHGREVPEKYLATAHGDFRNAPMTHFYYGTAETLYAFAPSYAASYRKAGAKCIIHVGKGMHHCYAMQYFIPGCKPAFNEVMQLIRDHFRKGTNI